MLLNLPVKWVKKAKFDALCKPSLSYRYTSPDGGGGDVYDVSNPTIQQANRKLEGLVVQLNAAINGNEVNPLSGVDEDEDESGSECESATDVGSGSPSGKGSGSMLLNAASALLNAAIKSYKVNFISGGDEMTMVAAQWVEMLVVKEVNTKWLELRIQP